MRTVTLCFCKQKTAYELRISDWSSDVCSSDLPLARAQREFGVDRSALGAERDDDHPVGGGGEGFAGVGDTLGDEARPRDRAVEVELAAILLSRGLVDPDEVDVKVAERSEEHTSEIQSLMRISSAALFLKQQ